MITVLDASDLLSTTVFRSGPSDLCQPLNIFVYRIARRLEAIIRKIPETEAYSFDRDTVNNIYKSQQQSLILIQMKPVQIISTYLSFEDDIKNSDYFSQFTLLVCIKHQSKASEKHVTSVFRVYEAVGFSTEFGKLYEIRITQTKLEGSKQGEE